MTDTWKNKLYFGDNLGIMREYIPDESVDLIYLDPPFNSKATYNVLFAEKNGTQSGAQITAFEDTWHWGQESEEAYHEIVTQGPKRLVDLIQALRTFLGQNDMMAYLVMMAIRLVEMHRVLKLTGSIYLHCDNTANPHLRLIMDAIFGEGQRRNEVVWWYPNKLPAGGRVFDRQYDKLLFYVKNAQQKYTFHEIRIPTEYRGTQLVTKKVGGKRIPVYDPITGKQLRVQATDKPLGDVWRLNLIHPQSKERLGYPTQKPETLLEYIIKASSNEESVVMDPFCGCGTAIAVAERLNRRWIGIDITHLAITLLKNRLEEAFTARSFEDPNIKLSPYEVIGDPKDLQSAKALAKHDRYQFEWWALGKVSARPAQDKKKGADGGIDGVLYFIDDNSGQAKKIVVQVKSGHVKLGDIHALNGVVKGEKAAIGAFITLQNPTRPMKEEAAAAGFYEPEYFPGKLYPKMQILTIEEILNGRQLEYPRVAPEVTFKKAERKTKDNGLEQAGLF